MKTLAFGSGDMQLRDLAELAGQEAVIVTRHNRPLFAVIPVAPEDVETWQLGENPQFLLLMQRAWDRAAQEGFVTMEDARRRLLHE
jgi:antitoxin (DNA-binding transcriptional repressor) of toxin-antitoxin stability system